MTLAEKIKKRRKELNLTQGDVAEKVGVATQTIYKYETGLVTNMPLDRLELLAKALEVTSAYLIGWAEEPYKKADALSDIYLKIKNNPTFYKLVEKLYELNDQQLEAVYNMLSTF